MRKKRLLINSLILGLWVNIIILSPKVRAAEQVSFTNGIFSRTISIESFEYLAETGEAKGALKNLIKLSNQSPKKLSELLNREFKLPLLVTSKLIYSSIGEVIIIRSAEIIHPIKTKDKTITIPAIRSAIINGINVGNGQLNLIQFLKSYPNKKMAIDIPALFKVLNKVESMSELVEFFSQSPIEGIKKAS